MTRRLQLFAASLAFVLAAGWLASCAVAHPPSFGMSFVVPGR